MSTGITKHKSNEITKSRDNEVKSTGISKKSSATQSEIIDLEEDYIDFEYLNKISNINKIMWLSLLLSILIFFTSIVIFGYNDVIHVWWLIFEFVFLVSAMMTTFTLAEFTKTERKNVWLRKQKSKLSKLAIEYNVDISWTPTEGMKEIGFEEYSSYDKKRREILSDDFLVHPIFTITMAVILFITFIWIILLILGYLFGGYKR